MPRVIFETEMADQRLPISVAFMLIACAQVSLHHPVVRHGFAAVLIVLLALRITEVQRVWDEVSLTTDSFRQSVRSIERGSTVLVAYADPDAGDELTDQGLIHAACLAIIDRSALVTTAFTVVGKQIMQVRDIYRARVDSADGYPPSFGRLTDAAEGSPDVAGEYWERWTSEYDYLYLLFTERDHENPDPARLTTIYVGDKFALYRIVRIAPPPEPQAEPEIVDATAQGTRAALDPRKRDSVPQDKHELPTGAATSPLAVGSIAP
jgi:hypothetical protein